MLFRYSIYMNSNTAEIFILKLFYFIFSDYDIVSGVTPFSMRHRTHSTIINMYELPNCKLLSLLLLLQCTKATLTLLSQHLKVSLYACMHHCLVHAFTVCYSCCYFNVSKSHLLYCLNPSLP